MENARGLGRHLAQWLLARGEIVRDVPSTATAPVRELPRGRHKNDVIDAAAAASVAALQGDASPVTADDLATVLGLLDERHSAPAAPAETAREQLARDLVTEIRGTDRRLKMLTANIAATVAEHGSKLPETEGIGPVIADRLLGRTHRASRFPMWWTRSCSFAQVVMPVPVEVTVGDEGAELEDGFSAVQAHRAPMRVPGADTSAGLLKNAVDFRALTLTAQQLHSPVRQPEAGHSAW